MSSAEEDHREDDQGDSHGEEGSVPLGSKKRKIQRACDTCRRKKGACFRTAALAVDHHCH